MGMTGWLHGSIAGILLCTGCSHSVAPSDVAPETASLEAADLALARGDFEQANRAFDKILERTPDHPRALLGSARASLSAGRGEVALARFAAYRAKGNAWNKAEHWQYCAALALASDQILASGQPAAGALGLAQRLESEGCRNPRASDLILRGWLAVADEARRAGRSDRALEIYLSLISGDGETRGFETRDSERGRLDPVVSDSARARAYLAAAELLVEARRREEALALLSQGLDELPANRDLVAGMVAVLAGGSPALNPRASPSAESRPAATD